MKASEPQYHFKNNITHPEKLVADKANYFADYFEFVCSNLGQVDLPQLENHKSLIEKIDFQLENFTSHSVKYLNHYFANEFLTLKDELIKEHYHKEWKQILKLKRESDKFTNERIRAELHKKIKDFSTLLDQTLFRNALNGIVLAIQCKYPLHKHNHISIFEYCTPIVVCEFAFAGFHLSELKSLFRLIFEREISLEENRVKTKAPLPTELYALKTEPEKFYNAAKSYLDKRSLKQQFEGIYYLYKNSLTNRTIIFPLSNVETYVPVKLAYEDVKIINRLSKIYAKNRVNKNYYSFFTKRKKLFVEVTVLAGDEETALKYAVRKANNAINYLNTQLKLNIRLETRDYVYCEDGVCTRKSKFPDIIRDSTKKSFIKNDVRSYLKFESKLKQRIISADRIYFQALGALNDEDKLVNLWRYMECFFDKYDYKASEVLEKMSKLLSRFSITTFAFLNFNFAVQILYNSGPGLDEGKFGITRNELWTLLHPKYYVDANFTRISEILNHPFVNRRLVWQLTTADAEKMQVAEKFYANLLFEAYEQRNLLEHNATFKDKSVQKIMLRLPEVVRTFRNIMVECVKLNKFSSFDGIIESIVKGELDDIFKRKN